MDLSYVIDPAADEPIMLIDKWIGMDEVDGEGIMGDKFSRQLLFLDTQNKKRIHVYMNTEGGSVTDGQQIYNTILKVKTKVDTHNIGMVASIGLPIFLAGSNRYMMDNAVAMLHPVSGGDFKARAALDEAVNTMLSSRTQIPADKISEMMARTTWLNAEDCGPNGFNMCAVESSSEYNKPRKRPESEGVKATWKAFSSVVNKLIEDKKPQQMSIKVTNRLKLTEGSNEELQIAAIDKIENRATEAEAKLVKQEVEWSEKLKVANSAAEAIKTEKEKVESTLKALDLKSKNEAAVKNKAEAEALIKAAVEKGQIVDEPEVVKDWTDQAEFNLDKTKNMIDKLPINRQKPGTVVNTAVARTKEEIEKAAVGTAPSIDTTNPGAFVAQMNAKVMNRAKERFK